jgi:sporulation protein YlmC with PRC-barrel domain
MPGKAAPVKKAPGNGTCPLVSRSLDANDFVIRQTLRRDPHEKIHLCGAPGRVRNRNSRRTSPQQAPQPSGSAAQILTSIPANSVTITHWYKQNVYDPSDNKIGEIMDVLVDRAGKATALIIGVWRLSRNGRKGWAVPFDAVQVTSKDNNKWYLMMNSSKDALKSAKGFKYDRNAMTWMPE